MRKINQLRKMFPTLQWWYEWPSIWKNSAGWQVQGFARLSPKYDGDDESYITVYYRSDNNQAVFLL